MYVIIPASNKTTTLSSISAQTSKLMVPICGQPVIYYILKELHQYQEVIDEIVIVKENTNDIKEYLNYSITDDFFKTKIHCVNNEGTTGLTDDFFVGLSFLVDSLHVRDDRIILWDAEEIIFNSSRLVDVTLPSFYCIDPETEENVDVFRFDDFAITINTSLFLHDKEIPYTIDEFITEYKHNSEIIPLTDFGDYKRWQNPDEYNALCKELIESTTFDNIQLSINENDMTVTKTNKYSLMEYSFDNKEKSFDVAYNLFREYDFLAHVDKKQQMYLPQVIDRGIKICGDYTNSVTEEFVYGLKLSEILMNVPMTSQQWKKIIQRIGKTLSCTFHKDNLEESYDVWNNYVPQHMIDEYYERIRENLHEAIDDLADIYSAENIEENMYVIPNNEKAEWHILIDKFCDRYVANNKNVIYQGTCDRFVHGGMYFDNILLDIFSNKMTFINPQYKTWELVDKNLDYMRMYCSCYCGLDVLLSGKYIEDECGCTITIPKSINNNMMICTSVIDSACRQNEENIFKMGSILLTIKYVYDKQLSPSKAIPILRYMKQIKDRLFFKMITRG